MSKILIGLCINPWCSEYLHVANYNDLRCPLCGKEIHVFNNLKNGIIEIVEFVNRFRDEVDYVELVYSLDAMLEIVFASPG